MEFDILTLFPEVLRGYFESSIMAKSVEKDLIRFNLVNIRDFAADVHKTCDDSPYGGGAGMLMLPTVLDGALRSVKAKKKRVVYLTPSGVPLTQSLCCQLAEEQNLVLICGRYEGIDQRIIDEYVTDEISVGDYVLSSGDVAAMVLIDSVYRLIDGVISKESLEEESFSNGLLEYPQYTRPEVFNGVSVPEVLLSGHHAKIAEWRLRKRVEKTLRFRPDLIARDMANNSLPQEVRKIIDEITACSRFRGTGKRRK